jgi:hypothetical protein
MRSHRGLVYRYANDRGRLARSDEGLHMHASRRLLLMTVITAAVFTSTIASANKLALSANNFRIVSGIGEREGFVICPLTLEGSFHSSTFHKAPNALIGYITRAALEEESCTGGNARYLQETLPWHIQFAGFSGSLPNIALIGTKIIGLGILLTRLGISCLYRTTEAFPGILIWNREAEGLLRSIRWSEAEMIPSNTCLGVRTNLIGFSENVTELGTTRRIALMLI